MWHLSDFTLFTCLFLHFSTCTIVGIQFPVFSPRRNMDGGILVEGKRGILTHKVDSKKKKKKKKKGGC